MLSNDINKKLMLRFKRSKDFDKLIIRLEKEGYSIKETKIDDNKYNIKVFENNNILCSVVYEYSNNPLSEYKQTIFYIVY